MEDRPEQGGERGRVHAHGQHLRGGAPCTLLFVQGQDESWAIYGLGDGDDCGVGLPRDAMVTLAEAILDRAYR